jgi:hypothetical protein
LNKAVLFLPRFVSVDRVIDDNVVETEGVCTIGSEYPQVSKSRNSNCHLTITR